jgi:hypothetical protein
VSFMFLAHSARFTCTKIPDFLVPGHSKVMYMYHFYESFVRLIVAQLFILLIMMSREIIPSLKIPVEVARSKDTSVGSLGDRIQHVSRFK